MKVRIAVHASEGSLLRSFLLDEKEGGLVPTGEIALPNKVQYGCYGSQGQHLYIATSDGGPRRAGTRHEIVSLEVDPANGTLSLLAEPRSLPARSVAICLDKEATHLLSVSNEPIGLSVSLIGDDGAAGDGASQPIESELGIFPHQVRMLPDGKRLVVVARGYPQDEAGAKTPGSLRVFRYEHGRLTPESVIAPAGGAQFGARNLDYHPLLPIAYVGLETQNRLMAFPLMDGAIATDAIADITTLQHPDAADARQIAGSVKVHPSGRYVYAINRADGTAGDGVFCSGENSIAVFQLDEEGMPRSCGHVSTGGIHARTFAMDPSGRWMVVANMKPRRLPGGRLVPPSLTTFIIGDDGMPSLQNSLPIPFDEGDLTNNYGPQAGARSMFWMGLSALSFHHSAESAMPTIEQAG